MPIFDYQCEACGHTFDVLQKAGEGALKKCPECGKLKLRKQLAAPNFHLKGSGWYKTDFRDKAGAKAGAAESKGDGEKSDGKGGDAKGGDGKASDGKPSDAKPSDARKGHSLDKATDHSHDKGHTHSHGGHSHSHGPGGHKH